MKQAQKSTSYQRNIALFRAHQHHPGVLHIRVRCLLDPGGDVRCRYRLGQHLRPGPGDVLGHLEHECSLLRQREQTPLVERRRHRGRRAVFRAPQEVGQVSSAPPQERPTPTSGGSLSPSSRCMPGAAHRCSGGRTTRSATPGSTRASRSKYTGRTAASEAAACNPQLAGETSPFPRSGRPSPP